MKKKMICTMMACAMMGTTLLSACGSKGVVDGDAGTAGETTGPVDVTIAAVRDDSYAPWSDATMIKELEEECKDFINITWIDIPQSTRIEKLNLAFSGGDYPDVILGSWALDGEKIVEYANQGILLPLEEYFTEELMPNWSSIWKDRSELMNGLKLSDGHVYTMVNGDENAIRDFNDTVLINTEWLEKVGKEMPTTTDELYDVLKAFKEAGDLNGNGKNDEIPMSCVYGTDSFGEHIKGMMSMFGWFGVAQNQQGMQMMDDKIIFNAAQPEYKEAVEYFNKLYQEGLMDIETFTHSNAAYGAKTINANPAQVGVFVEWNDVTVNNTLGNEVYQYLPPLTSPNGKKPQCQRNYRPITFYRCGSLTDKAAGKEEAIMKFFDKFYEQERSMEILFGGKKYIEKKDGNLYHQVTDENGIEYGEDVRSSETPGKFCLYYLKDGAYEWDVETAREKTNKKLDAIYGEYLQSAPEFKNEWIDREESMEMSLISPDLTNYVRETTARWITKGGVEEEWDSYLAELNKLKVNEWMTMSVRPEFQDKIQKVE